MRDYAAADDLLGTLRGAIEAYGSVSVYELYDTLYNDDTVTDIDVDFADNYIGWTNLDDAYVKRLNARAFKVVLPKPIMLK